ncbi:invasion associated locus B family protein [Methylosinus sp. H3A]|uniref:invasion associated locus B family protein n=1 Tax=Methylosinus sp. H3A TaxID=2785786 RepID=UPI0018C23BF4|nr:invasion associated locus B family protein [Methylosinus sp. H3A]MBG0809725.1 invasion associated locus B family protein [Methylosinus sp. H3A]
MARSIAPAIFFLFTQISVVYAVDRPSAPAVRAAAPAKPAAAPPSGDAPRVFGDWQLRCLAGSAPQPARRNCEILQSVLVKDKSSTIAEIAFGKPDANDSMAMTIVVPVNVAFQAGPRVTTSDVDTQPLDLVWRRCASAGCFASAALGDQTLARWRAYDGLARIVFKSAAGQDAVLPVSFRGLAQALDALGRER